MSEKKHQAKHGKRRVTFSLEASDAKGVQLIGDFNNWDSMKHPMRKDKSGIWKKIIYIYPGRYEYKFQVDRKWLIDPNGAQACMNCYGTYNSVIIVD